MSSAVRASARALRRTPSFVALVLLMLSLGIGATGTLFAVIHPLLIEPLPYPDAERLVWLRESHAEVPARPISYPTFLDWQTRNGAFSVMAAVRDMRLRWTTIEEARVVDVAVVTADYFRVFDLNASIGRDFAASDDVFGAEPVAIVSHRFWEAELGGDSSVLGSEIVLDDTSFSIIGVAPSQPRLPGDVDAWILAGAQAAPGSAWLDRSVRWAGFAVARLQPGATIGEARADMARVQERLAAEYPRYTAGHDVEVLELRDVLVGEMRLPLLLSFGAVGVLLAMLGVNVSNLLLVRSIGRQREFAIRAALGASRRAIASQILIDSALLVAVGSMLGLLVAAWGARVLGSVLADRLFAGMTIQVDLAVVGYTVGLGVALVACTSWFPISRAIGPHAGVGLNETRRSLVGPSQGRGFSAFLVVQTSLSVLLLICAALLASSMLRVIASDPGFDRAGVLTFRLQLPNEYSDPSQLNPLYARLVRALETIPGASAVAVFNDLPGLEPGWQSDIAPEVDGELLTTLPGEEINVDWRIVSAGYFETMGMSITGGRSFTDDEAERGAPVMLVDESLARRFWPDGNALGSYIRYDSPTPIEIIGTVDDVRVYGVEEPGRITIYTPFGRFPFLGEVGVAIRGEGVDPSSLAGPARQLIRSIDSGVAIHDVATLERRLDQAVALRELTTRIVLAFASLATLLSAVGLYSVMRYVVGQRRRELGLRVALGAQRHDVAGLVLRRGMLVSLVGTLLGVLLAVGASRLLSSLLFGIGPLAPSIYASVAALSLIVAMFACAVPAWRAARADPLTALRAE